ncbi:hypothetical protein YTPLAS18_00430 [Nitrospira sp.]|nr:hypothetical protein YTPLAS18_00430 [Nitrospira sp.]
MPVETIQAGKESLSCERRAYHARPEVHEFLLNYRDTHVRLCGLSQRGREGTNPSSRFRLATGIEAAEHMIASFKTLFDLHWRKPDDLARAVEPRFA